MSAVPVERRGWAARLIRAVRAEFTGNTGDVVFKSVALLFTLLIVVLAGLLVTMVARESMPSIREFGFFSFVVSTEWNPVTREFGAAHVAVGTLVAALIALVIAVPVAVGIALFVTELAPPWLRGPVAFLVDILAAIPSIVYGLWGIFVLIPFMHGTLNPFLIDWLGWTGLFARPQFGYSMLAAGLVLAIMVVPIISAVTREVIAQVPRDQPEAMLALGATRWETIWHAVLPYARAGIVGAVILGLARAIGETMAVTMVIGNWTEIRANLLATNATMASLIASQFREATFSLHISALIHVGLVLMIISLIVNASARLLVWTVGRGRSGGR